jgi:hypothetical protein
MRASKKCAEVIDKFLMTIHKNSFLSFTAVPIVERDAYVVSMDYSPLLAGFSIVLKDGRAAFLTSSNLKFDPNVSGTISTIIFN